MSNEHAEELVDVEVGLPAVTVEAVDEEVRRKQAETGGEHTREEFIRFAISDLLERVEADRRDR